MGQLTSDRVVERGVDLNFVGDKIFDGLDHLQVVLG
jgi:hypothetical protein